MTITGDDVNFESTGRISYANRGIIGLSPKLAVTGGYDDGLIASDLTDAEAVEMANYMIALWQRFKEKYDPVPSQKR
jgi:hypothetical protein